MFFMAQNENTKKRYWVNHVMKLMADIEYNFTFDDIERMKKKHKK